ncbi:MAG: hypothetical protein ABSE46_06535 [Terracidiphilus sp.]|jgi:hypothetical protein
MHEPSSSLLQQNPDAIASTLINKAEYRDGLQEIAVGAMILIYACLFSMTQVFKGSLGLRIFLWGNLLLMLPIGYAFQWAIKKVRKRFLIGKVGYVKYKPINRKKLGARLLIILGLGCIIAAVAALAMLKVLLAAHHGVAHWALFPPAGWILVGLGIYGGAFMIFRVRSLRYIIAGLTMVALGIVLALLEVSTNSGLAILLAFAGLLPFISGWVVFFLFLRQPSEQAQ